MDFPYRKSRIEAIKSSISDEKIKVVYGPSGCGKTSFLSDIQDHLLKNKVTPSHIISLNLQEESLHSWRSLNNHLKRLIKDGKKHYFLLDEITEVEDFSKALESIKDNYLCSIFVTASDQQALLSGINELDDGEWQKIFLNTLSFNEVIQLYKASKKSFSIENLFNEYIYFGGYPDRFITDLSPEAFLPKFLRSELYESVYSRHPHLSFSRFYEATCSILKKTGEPFSGQNIKTTLKKKKVKLDRTTASRYANRLEEIFLIEKVPIYLESKKEYERGGFVYYSLDNGLLTAAGCKDELLLLRTAIFNKLKLDGYNVSVAKTYKGLIDFRIEKDNKIAFIKAALRLSELNDEGKKEIYSSFKTLISAAPRYVISFDEIDSSFMGIKNVNAIEFLQGKQELEIF